MHRSIIAAAALVVLATGGHAEETLVPIETHLSGRRADQRSPDPAFGTGSLAAKLGPVALILDDGSFENGYSFATAFSPEFVEWVPMPASSGLLTVLQACFVTLYAYLPGELAFEYVVYSVGGGGLPGVALGSLGVSNPETVPPLTHTCISTAIVPFVVGEQIYFGARWDGFFEPDLYISADENGSSVGPGFGRRHGLDGGWAQLGTPAVFPAYRNLGLALVWMPQAEIFTDGFESGNTSAWTQDSL